MSIRKETPPGWDYNPSQWLHRLPLVILAITGFFIACYLSLYQLKVFPSVFEPLFGKGSEEVLNSYLAKALPVPDALLGASGYVVDVIAGLIGGTERWKTKPWIVILFGVAAGFFGLTSILLVISQPVFLNAWCTLCLCSAAISIVIISPATIEMLASLQFLQRVKRSGNSVWKAFWGNREIINRIV